MALRFSSSASSISGDDDYSCSGRSQNDEAATPSIPGDSSLSHSRHWLKNKLASSSTQSASRDSLLGHQCQTLLSVTSPFRTPSLTGDTVHLRSDVEPSYNEAAYEVSKTNDDTSSPWNSRKDYLIILVFYCWSSCLLTYLAFALLSPTVLYFQTTTACLPDGNFNIYSDSYSPWATEGTFQITMAYGAISFGQAKVIDVIWDVVSLLLSVALS